MVTTLKMVANLIKSFLQLDLEWGLRRDLFSRTYAVDIGEIISFLGL